MHPSVVGLPCRLVLMVAHPGFPVDQPCDRQAPRAPLPQSGVTFMGKTSCAFSKGITLSSSLIRTHAPNLYPPSDFGLPLFERSLQVAASPCCVKALPNAVSVVLPCVPGPLLQLLPRCCLPFLPLGLWPSPSKQRVGAWHLSISYFRWGTLLELQSFLYVPAHRFVCLTDSSHPYTCVSGSRDFYGRAYHGWLPAPCSGYANHPNRAIDGKGTRTPQVRQPCWLLRFLAFASLNRACRDLVPAFPQRSPPWYLAKAACGGLRSAHDCRPRRALLHHSHSWAPPIRRRRFRVTRPLTALVHARLLRRNNRLSRKKADTVVTS